jgi:hypothetical protein
VKGRDRSADDELPRDERFFFLAAHGGTTG